MKIFVFLCLTVFSLPTFAQEAKKEVSESPYKNYNLKFVIADESENGTDLFADKKSYWTFKYELRFLDEGKNLKYTSKSAESSANLSQNDREKSIKQNNKKYDKAWKKGAVLVAKGKVEKKPLAIAQNREITIPVTLPESVKTTLAEAVNTWNNPQYRVSIKGKFFIQTPDGKKSKQKIDRSFVCLSKLQTKDAQAWTINSCGIFQGLKKSNEKVQIGSSSVIN